MSVQVDDGDAAFVAPGWQLSANGHNGDARLGRPSLENAIWNMGDLEPGRYRVQATWSSGTNRATDAAFSIYGGNDLLTSSKVNQRTLPTEEVDGTMWQDLGVVELVDGSLRITLKPGTDGLTIADAVKVELVESVLPGHYLQTVRPGNWSDPNTWASGRVPTELDDVSIQHDVLIDQAVAKHVEIADGTATLAGSLDVYGSVVVRSALTGDRGAIRFHIEDDRQFVGNIIAGPLPDLPDFHIEDVGLWAMPGSTVQLHGEFVTPWLDAVAMGPAVALAYGAESAPAFGDGNAKLSQAPIGWKVGDSLLLVNEMGESRLGTLVDISGTELHYELTPSDLGGQPFVGNVISAEGRSIAPKISNLSRRLQIVSVEVVEGDFDHRAHSLFFGGSSVNISNVEFRNLGPRGKLGRYPVHFHHGGESSNSLEGASIWQDVSQLGNRFVALHGVQGLTIANNVAFASQGHGFFMEDGNEYGNRIIGNLAVNVANGEELKVVDGDVKESHHFWLRTGNTIEGNVAAGGTGIGLVILPSKSPSQSTTVTDQVVLGGGKYGIWSFAPDVAFENASVAYAQQAGFAAIGRWGRDSSGTLLIDPFLILNGRNSPGYQSQIFLNQAIDIRVEGGVIVGRKAIHTHYSSNVTLVDTTIRAHVFMTPTYWESEVVADRADIVAMVAFDRAYPIRRYSPGLVRLVNSRWQFGDVGSALNDSVDFVGIAFKSYPGFGGEQFQNAWKLKVPVVRAGYLELPANVKTWKVAAPLQAIEQLIARYRPNSKSQWLGSTTGYPFGLPPGVCQVAMFDAAGGRLGRLEVIIESGKITKVKLPSFNSWDAVEAI